MNPLSALNDPEWFGFDIAVMSMALHHVSDPVEMLRRLGQRLKNGRTLVIVDWLQDEAAAAETNGGIARYDQADMIEVIGKQKIWPGFTSGRMEETMTAAGFDKVELKVCEGVFSVPEHASRGKVWRENRMFFAKAVWH